MTTRDFDRLRRRQAGPAVDAPTLGDRSGITLDRFTTARSRGRCSLCGRPTLPGQRIGRVAKLRIWVHAECAGREDVP